MRDGRALPWVIAAALTAAAGAALASDAKPAWFADESDEAAVAKWGIPQSDAVGFEVKCAGAGRVVMAPALYAPDRPDAVPDIVFTVDGEPYVRSATLTFSERDAAWQAEAVVPTGDALVAALRRGSTLAYDFSPPLREGDRFSLSLSGSARAIDAALEGC